MRIRRLLSMLSAAVLISAFALPTVALADDFVTFTASTSPEALAADGQVTLNVTVTNDANNPNTMEDVQVQRDGTTIITMKDIQPSNSMQGSCQLQVSASELGLEIPLKLSWTEGGAAMSKTASVTVASSATARPEVDFSRTLTSTTAVAGDKVTLSYTVKNTGSIDITDVRITDRGIDDLSKQWDKLSPGSTVEYNYDMTVESDVTSTPKLTYTANGKEYTKTLTAKKVLLTQADLDVVLEISPDTVKSGDEVTLLCTLTNSGNVQLSSIVISDDTLGSKLYTLSKLDPGAKKSFTKKVTLTETTSFQFTIKARDANKHDVTFQSNKATATVQAAQAQNLNLEIIATCNTVQLTEPGTVTFDIDVTNKSDTAVANVQIVDQDGNPITVIDNLPPGKVTKQWETLVKESTVFSFSAVVDLPDSDPYKVSSGPIEVPIVQPIPTLEPSEMPTEEVTAEPSETAVTAPAQASGRLGTLIALLAVVGVLIVVTAIALVVMIIKEKKRRA